jgi:uncharacterized protein YicC (UPF0701 family)
MDRPHVPEVSEMLTRLAQQAKKVENSFADLAELTDSAAEARRDQAEVAATAAVNQLDKDITAMTTAAAAEWSGMQAGIDKEIKAIQSDIAERKRARDVRHAEQAAEAAKSRADWAVAYAAAAADAATFAVLDYNVARRDAEAIKRK